VNLPLEQPLFLLLIPLGVGLIWILVRQERGIGFSSVSLLEGMRGVSYVLVQRILLSGFVAASAVVLAKPVEFVKTSVPVYADARDIIVVLDISSSMNSGSPSNLKISKEVIANFVTGRPGDRVGLFTFDTRFFFEWPLSLDHDSLRYRLGRVRSGGGTKISEGMLGGLNYLQDFGRQRGAMIVVSDGLSAVSPEDRETISRLVGETRTRVYWIWIGEPGEELSLAFAGYVEQLGGIVYVGAPQDLGEIFTEISRLETSQVVLEQQVQSSYRFGIWPALALITLAAAAAVGLLKEV